MLLIASGNQKSRVQNSWNLNAALLGVFVCELPLFEQTALFNNFEKKEQK